MRCHGAAFALVVLFALGVSTAKAAKLTSEQSNVLEDARAYALRYVDQLPNFVCTQVTRRETGVRENLKWGIRQPERDTVDTVEEQLTFTAGKEHYKVITINGKEASGVTHEQLTGASSWGEFGSQFAQIFNPKSKTTFNWDEVVQVNGRVGWAYKYRVPQKAGNIIVDQPTRQAVVVPFFGKVVIDPETKDVLEISSTLDVSYRFPIQNVTRRISYDIQQIGGKRFCLPAHAEMHMEVGTRVYDNQIEFKDYHHFSSESTIHFDSPNP